MNKTIWPVLWATHKYPAIAPTAMLETLITLTASLLLFYESILILPVFALESISVFVNTHWPGLLAISVILLWATAIYYADRQLDKQLTEISKGDEGSIMTTSTLPPAPDRDPAT